MIEGDLLLIWKCLAGDATAFEGLYAAHAGRVAGFFHRSGFAHALADDLTQETFLRAFRSLSTFDPARASFATWLGTIARNVARQRWSRRREGENFDPELAQEMFAAPEDASQAPEAREELAALRDCLEVLPKDLAGLIRLRYVEGMTTRGVAAASGVPESTVRLRLCEAQAMLHRCMKDKGFLG